MSSGSSLSINKSKSITRQKILSNLNKLQNTNKYTYIHTGSSYTLGARSISLAKKLGATVSNPLIYNPHYRVVGLMNDVYNTLNGLGFSTAQLTESFKLPGDEEYIKQHAKPTQPRTPRKPSQKKALVTEFSFEQYIDIISQLSSTGQKVGKQRKRIVSTNDIAAEINSALDRVFKGQVGFGLPGNQLSYIVNGFTTKGKGQKKKFSVKSIKFIYPVLLANGVAYTIPIGASAENQGDFNAFIDNILPLTNYNEYRDTFKNAFAESLRQHLEKAKPQKPESPIVLPNKLHTVPGSRSTSPIGTFSIPSTSRQTNIF